MASWRRLFGEDAVIAAKEAEVFGLVADLFNTCPARTNAKINVREVTVLRIMRPDANGCGIAILDFKINIGQRAVKRARIGVNNFSIGGFASPITPVPAREPDHVLAFAFLKAGSVGAENEHRPIRSATQKADARRNLKRMGKPVSAFGDQHDTFAQGGLGDLIDRRLNHGRVIRNTIAFQLRKRFP